MSLSLAVDSGTWSQVTHWSELMAAAAKHCMEDSKSSSGSELFSTGIAVMNAWHCSLNDDGSLVSPIM